MKGVILAGGNGTRLFPLTISSNKHLLPIYDKPMIYYSLSALMLAGIREICIICKQSDVNSFTKLLGNGSKFGLQIVYLTQDQPLGIPHGLLQAREFVGDSNVCLMLGDNILYGTGLASTINSKLFNKSGASIFTYTVRNPQDYGVAVLDKDSNIIDLVEKPKSFISNEAIIGLYMFDNTVFDICNEIKPSARGELEIIDILKHYLQINSLFNIKLSRGYAWLDTGTTTLINQASNFVQAIQDRQGHIICSPEEIALKMQYIDIDKFNQLVDHYPDSLYKHSLRDVIK